MILTNFRPRICTTSLKRISMNTCARACGCRLAEKDARQERWMNLMAKITGAWHRTRSNNVTSCCRYLRNSRNILIASTTFESRGLRRRHAGPRPTPRTPDGATRGIIQGRDSEEIDDPCLVEVLLIRPLPRRPAVVWASRGERSMSARAGREPIRSIRL